LGFFNTNEMADDFNSLIICFNIWLDKKMSVEESWEDSSYYNALCDVGNKIYTAKSIPDLADHIKWVWASRFPEEERSFDDCLIVAKDIFNALRK
jgi:hypothetical protein